MRKYNNLQAQQTTRVLCSRYPTKTLPPNLKNQMRRASPPAGFQAREVLITISYFKKCTDFYLKLIHLIHQLNPSVESIS